MPFVSPAVSVALMRVLLVEDSNEDARALEALLEESGYVTDRARSLAQAMALLRTERFDVILLDLGLPDSESDLTLERLRGVTTTIPIVVLTGRADEEAALAAVAAGAQDYLTKGATDGATLLRAIRYARERHVADERLRVSEERFRVLIENGADGVALLDADGRFRYSSPAITRILGWDAKELQSRRVFDIVHEDDRAEAHQSFDAVLRGALRFQLTQRRYLCKDGGTRVIEVTRANRLDDPTVGAVVVNFRDVTDRQRITAALDALRRQYELILDSIADGVHGISLDGRIVFANRVAEQLLGWGVDELIGRPAHETMHHSRREGTPLARVDCAIHATLTDGVTRHVREEVFWRRDGSPLLVDYTVAPMRDAEQRMLGGVITFRDVTRQKQLEAQVDQARRVTSLGRVAASVAHEFNNVLMSIQPYAEAIQHLGRGNEKLNRPVGKILAAMKSGQRLTTQILRFTNPADPVFECLDLQQWLRELSDEAQHLLQDRALQFEVERSFIVRADAMQLQQVLMNLIVNARDASSPGSPVTIGVECAADVPFVVPHVPDPQSSVALYVRDRGAGIAPEIADQIFEPLFTTKRRGGTGLGLSVAHQIVTRHQGKILVDTAPGAGTTFYIVLPHFTANSRSA
ncbi:MAG TPA: PAS domain S-box protein [Thermoanaerobaculia bacterium]|nr:PAS domain S-box protein [Thermoanaerobaculia bacterium]